MTPAGVKIEWEGWCWNGDLVSDTLKYQNWLKMTTSPHPSIPRRSIISLTQVSQQKIWRVSVSIPLQVPAVMIFDYREQTALAGS